MQVLTIHRSKGLEFPVVYLPVPVGAVPGAQGRAGHLPRPRRLRRATVDVGLEGADFRRHAQQHQAEERGEELRLAYVALTRARHQAVLWWAGSYDTRDSALTRLLFSRDDDGTVAAVGQRRRRPTPRRARASRR